MRATLLLILAFGVAAPAAAQDIADYDYENLSFRGVGFDWGFIWPTKVTSTATYSVRADLGFLGPSVRIMPRLTYWSSEMEQPEIERLATQFNRLLEARNSDERISADDLGEIQWRDLSLALDAHVVWTVPTGLFTYAGVGGAAHVMNGSGRFINGTFVEDLLDSVTAGLDFMAGAEWQVTDRLRWYGEARYSWTSDVRYPGLRVGAMYMLPQGSATQSERTNAQRR